MTCLVNPLARAACCRCWPPLAGKGIIPIRRLYKVVLLCRDTPRASFLAEGEALAAHFGLENATAEQLRAIPPGPLRRSLR